MTRASLLHILDHVSGISETEVRELEQLAAAFPYCQTAHLLLAKAAHDQGSMLASQRLRHAATYAADRQLLRALLAVPPAAAPATVETALPAAATGATALFQALVEEEVQPLETSAEEVTNEPAPPAAEAPAETLPAAAETPNEPTDTADTEIFHVSVDAAPPAATPEATEPAADAAVTTAEWEPAAAAFAEEAQDQEAEDQEAQQPAAEPADALPAAPETPEPEATSSIAPAESSVEAEGGTADEAALEEAASENDSVDVPAVAGTELAAPAPASEAAGVAEADALPAAAPPIRPPAEAGTSRFEFGLAEPAPPRPAPLYQLPGLEDEDAEAAPPPEFPPFLADAELAYALLGGGSRLGHALHPADAELTQPLPHTAFFAPDALLLAHAAAHTPPPPVPSSLDLINRFLRNQPRLKAPVPRPAADEQADLSVRSTRAAPALASESLATIFVRQGKIDKAIEIYERLMVKQPEKSAYFADQIQKLKPQE